MIHVVLLLNMSRQMWKAGWLPSDNFLKYDLMETFVKGHLLTSVSKGLPEGNLPLFVDKVYLCLEMGIVFWLFTEILVRVAELGKKPNAQVKSWYKLYLFFALCLSIKLVMHMSRINHILCTLAHWCCLKSCCSSTLHSTWGNILLSAKVKMDMRKVIVYNTMDSKWLLLGINFVP